MALSFQGEEEHDPSPRVCVCVCVCGVCLFLGGGLNFVPCSCCSFWVRTLHLILFCRFFVFFLQKKNGMEEGRRGWWGFVLWLCFPGSFESRSIRVFRVLLL